MGGIVTRAAAPAFEVRVRKVVYISAPNYGAAKAYLALKPDALLRGSKTQIAGSRVDARQVLTDLVDLVDALARSDYAAASKLIGKIGRESGGQLGQQYRYSFSGDMKASWQGPSYSGYRNSESLDVLSGSVCGDPLVKSWTISETATSDGNSLPLTPTANFGVANPNLIYVFQGKDSSGIVLGEVDLKLLFSPGTYTQMSLQATKSGDIIGPTISPSSLPVVVAPVSSCP
jgi:hypothetical protein